MPRPRNSRLASAITAAVAAAKKLAATSDVMLGRISRKTTRPSRSPENTAEVTNSRDRRVAAWLRMTRAPVAQLVMATTMTIVHTERFGMYAARMIISGRPGMTRARLVTKPSTSSTAPGR